MSGRAGRRPSPATVIASVALFAALAGGAFAAKSAIDSRDIRNNSIISKDVKRDSLKGSDVRADSLRGGDVDEDDLAEVPSAASAALAEDAVQAGGIEVIHVEPFTLEDGASQRLFERGAFTLQASCAIDEGGDDFARVLISTTVEDSSFDGFDAAADLDPATPAADRVYMEASSPTGTPVFEQATDGAAFAPDGTEIVGNDAFGAVNLPADPPATCRFGGAFYVD